MTEKSSRGEIVSENIVKPRSAGTSRDNKAKHEDDTPCGLLVMDKPQGFTSFDLCAKLRGILRQKHTGHTGTLDPMATGVMIVLLGRAARAADLIPDGTKRYTAGFRLGVTTDTLDITGQILSRREFFCAREDIEGVLPEFTGEISQLPPMYSAVHVGGERLYKLARKGIEVERTPRTVTISKLALTSFTERPGGGDDILSGSEGTFDIVCSKGTYVRTLIDDIGRRLGCGAVMTSLRRTYAMGFSEVQAHTLEQIEALAAEGRTGEAVLPIDAALSAYRKCEVSEKQAVLYRNGGALSLARLKGMGGAAEGELVRVYGTGGFIGVGRVIPAKQVVDEGCGLELAPYRLLS